MNHRRERPSRFNGRFRRSAKLRNEDRVSGNGNHAHMRTRVLVHGCRVIGIFTECKAMGLCRRRFSVIRLGCVRNPMSFELGMRGVVSV